MSAYSITTSGLPQGVLTPMGALLFAASEPGAWYDPSDLSTLFQDAAGTTPVTAVEQPVGRILDKSGRGNHATQSTTTKRPVLSRLVNLFTESEFRNGVSDAPTRGGLVTATTMAGYLGAIAFGHDGATNSYAYKGNVLTSGVSYVLSVVVETTDGLPPAFGSAWQGEASNTFALVLSGTAISPLTYVVQALSGGRFLVTATAASSASNAHCGVTKYATNDARTFKVTAYDLRLSTDAHLPYQRVNTATDYDADPAKFPAYLRFDGVDDAMVTVGNVNLSGTDKVTVWAGITKAAGTLRQPIIERVGYGQLNSFALYANPLGVAGQSQAYHSGSSLGAHIYTVGSPAETMAVFAMTSNQSAPSLVFRLNGAQVASSVVVVGAGGYGNTPISIGASVDNAHLLNGRLYSLIVRGAQSNLSQIEATELYIKQKARLP